MKDKLPVSSNNQISRTNQPATDSNPELGWRILLDAMSDPALVLDFSGDIVHHNPQLVDIYPRVRTGQHISSLIRTPEFLQAIEDAEVGDAPRVIQLHDRVPVTRSISAIITALAVDERHALPTIANQPAALVAFRDITDQEQHAQMRADFIAHASHELRTPLSSLKIMVETLQGPARDDATAHNRFLGMMATQTDRMTRLIDDLLSLSRVERKVHLPPTDAVDIVELLEWVVQSMEPLAASHNVLLPPPGIATGGSVTEGSLEGSLENIKNSSLVRGEREELAQVFLNLMENAIKYGGAPGKVEIKIAHLVATRERPSRIAITVRDQGPGIAAEHIPRLTERFYRVSDAASREKGGTGLGLAIVKHIVSRHRGELAISSDIGIGSEFTVILPIM